MMLKSGIKLSIRKLYLKLFCKHENCFIMASGGRGNYKNYRKCVICGKVVK